MIKLKAEREGRASERERSGDVAGIWDLAAC
jgi:hypothetical protein